jgi:hypothetical protein
LQLNLNLGGGKKGAKAKGGKAAAEPNTFLGKLGQVFNPLKWLHRPSAIDTGESMAKQHL